MLLTTRNLELCLGANVRTNQVKIEKISISRAILFGIVRSLVNINISSQNAASRTRAIKTDHISII